MNRKNFVAVILAGLVTTMASSCATVGKDFAADNVQKIIIGTTTKSTIEQTYGKPWRTGIEDGKETWTYGYYRYKLIGKTQTKDLVVRFDKTGKVTSYSFNTE